MLLVFQMDGNVRTVLDEEEDMNFKPEKVEISVYEQQRLDTILNNSTQQEVVGGL